MKNFIIVLMVFTAILCYSQVNTANTQKVAPKSAKNVSIEEFRRFEKAVNKLVLSNEKLQAEKNVLEKKLNELDTGTILEKSQKFYSDSFSYLLVLVASLGILLYFFQRQNLKNERQLILKSFDNEKHYLLNEVYVENKKLKTAINTAIDNNKELENKFINSIEKTNYDFAITFAVMGGFNQKEPYVSCMYYIMSAGYVLEIDNKETINSINYFFKHYKILDYTLSRIKQLSNKDMIDNIRKMLDARFKKSSISTIEDYYEKCLDALNKKEAELKK